jgi:hypothetical protein
MDGPRSPGAGARNDRYTSSARDVSIFDSLIPRATFQGLMELQPNMFILRSKDLLATNSLPPNHLSSLRVHKTFQAELEVLIMTDRDL